MTDNPFDTNDSFDLLPFSFDLDDEPDTLESLPKPLRFSKHVAHRQYINGLQKQALTALLPELPPPDTDVYIIGNGSGGTFHLYDDAPVAFEFGHFIPVIVKYLGDAGCKLYISTWTMNRNHALALLEMIDDKRVDQLAVMTDPYFLRRESAVANQLVEGIRERGQRFAAFKNHVKAVAVANRDHSQFCTVLASANLSAQPRAENFTVSTDPGLYRFVTEEFFEAMFNGRTKGK